MSLPAWTSIDWLHLPPSNPILTSKRTINRNNRYSTKFISHTLTSMSPTLAVERIIGLPTKEGKMWAGKLDPANPHFTN
jgi:hypothetical protein